MDFVTCKAVGSYLVSASLKLEHSALINVPANCVHLNNDFYRAILIIGHISKQMFCSIAFEY